MLIAVLAAAVAQAAPVAVSVQSARPDFAATVALGQLLYLLDQAAWHSTDRMLKDVKDPAAAGVRGWIVEPVEKTFRVTYYGLSQEQPVPVYVAEFRNGKVSNARLVPLADRRPLGPEQRRMIAARSTGNTFERCVPQPFNTVVMPAAAGAPVDVYYLTPQTRSDAWPMGKHYRLRVQPDGRAGDTRAFARSCLTIGTEGLPKGAKPVALFVNNIVDPVPTEIHVFTALASRIPLIVQTSTGRWMVDGRTIRLAPRNAK